MQLQTQTGKENLLSANLGFSSHQPIFLLHLSFVEQSVFSVQRRRTVFEQRTISQLEDLQMM